MKGFLCEATLEGIFTGIYDAWASGLGHENVRVLLKEEYEPELFFQYEEVVPDGEKAEKVARSIRRKISGEAFRSVCRAAMSDKPDRADAVYRFLIEGFRYGGGVLSMLQLPGTARLFELSRKTANEAHQFLEFLRFEQLDNGALFARLSPKCRVLTLIAPHFSDRFSGENWVIYDDTHGEAAIHPALKEWVIAPLSEEEASAFLERHSGEDHYVDLWKVFFETIGIKERKNPACQRNLLPKWYRKNMTEFL